MTGRFDQLLFGLGLIGELALRVTPNFRITLALGAFQLLPPIEVTFPEEPAVSLWPRYALMDLGIAFVF